jgi:hypothetical protein
MSEAKEETRVTYGAIGDLLCRHEVRGYAGATRKVALFPKDEDAAAFQEWLTGVFSSNQAAEQRAADIETRTAVKLGEFAKLTDIIDAECKRLGIEWHGSASTTLKAVIDKQDKRLREVMEIADAWWHRADMTRERYQKAEKLLREMREKLPDDRSLQEKLAECEQALKEWATYANAIDMPKPSERLESPAKQAQQGESELWDEAAKHFVSIRCAFKSDDTPVWYAKMWRDGKETGEARAYSPRWAVELLFKDPPSPAPAEEPEPKMYCAKPDGSATYGVYNQATGEYVARSMMQVVAINYAAYLNGSAPEHFRASRAKELAGYVAAQLREIERLDATIREQAEEIERLNSKIEAYHADRESLRSQLQQATEQLESLRTKPSVDDYVQAFEESTRPIVAPVEASEGSKVPSPAVTRSGNVMSADSPAQAGDESSDAGDRLASPSLPAVDGEAEPESGKLTDDEIERELSAAGIDMQPAYERLRKMIDAAKECSTFCELRQIHDRTGALVYSVIIGPDREEAALARDWILKRSEVEAQLAAYRRDAEAWERGTGGAVEKYAAAQLEQKGEGK